MADAEKLPLRSEVPEETTWDLTHIFASDEAWNAALTEVQTETEQIAAYQGHLSEGPERLLNLLRLEDALGLAYGRLYHYAHMKLDEDTANGTYQAMKARVLNQYMQWAAESAWEVPEILSLPDGTLDAWYQAEPQLELYRTALNRVLRQKPHTLSDAEERLLALTAEMQDAPQTIYSNLTDADLTFPDAVGQDGTAHTLSHGTFVPLLKSEDRTLRKSAFQALYGVYGDHKNTLAATLAAQIRQLQFNARARRYPDALTAALDGTEVPTDVYTNLIAAVHDSLGSFYRYADLRKRLLGLDELHMYDMYVPIVSDVTWNVTFEEAKALCLQAAAPLGADYQAIMREGFDNRWIDVYENQGKCSGAYSSGGDPHPYVLMNFQGTLNDVFTLIHEMGHSIHTYLSRKHQPTVYSHYVIFVAEVASTCNEALLMQYLLKITADPRKRAYLVNYFLEQFRSTLYRQTMFAEFELEAGRMADRGEGLTADAFCELYGNLNALYFGPDVISDPEIALEWARIPHFYMNYYVYQYATGYSAAIALSSRILKEGEPAVRDYLNFLSAGSSKDPITLLKGAGVDMTTPEPVHQALAQFDALVDEMETLMAALREDA